MQDELESEGDVGKGGDQSPNSHVPADVRDEPASVLVVPFQNENLCARLVRKGGESESVDSEARMHTYQHSAPFCNVHVSRPISAQNLTEISKFSLY